MDELSTSVKIAWQIAANEAANARFQYIEPAHILIGLCSLEKINGDVENQPELIAEKNYIDQVLQSANLDPTRLRRQLRKRIGEGTYQQIEKTIHRSQTCRQLFDRAVLIKDGTRITSRELLVAIIENPGETISLAFDDFGIKISSLMSTAFSGSIGNTNSSADSSPTPKAKNIKVSSTPFLDQYGRDLTEEARQGKLGQLIGRRDEMLQLIQVLARLKKNNPVLVGEAGVGKTAIVEGLAQRIIQGKDARILGGKKLIELNISSVISGSQYRGEFEERLTKIINEVKANPEVILFIDEIHTIVGAGQIGSGGLDAGNILKPALARGDFRCIGATTISEYRNYIETDPALERRFEMIMVFEPTREETLEILRGVKIKFEEHHYVHFTEKALEAAVDLSIRFDPGHQLPDKAVSLLDTAGSNAVVPRLSMVAPLTKIEATDHPIMAEVDENNVAELVSRQTGIDIGIISPYIGKTYLSRILELTPYLKKRIVGQDDAIDRVTKRLLVAQSGLSSDSGPLATFLFTGPSGVGKTQLAIYLSEFLFGNQDSLIRLDMSEYKEEHSVSKLVGSPPGYVGYEEEGQLTSKLRTHPYSVVLLDECEKAHPRVFDMFLQVFDAGRLTDSKGRTIDTRNVVFILTSNISSIDQFYDNKSEQVIENETKSRLGEYFRIEFLNRIDEIIVFRSLTEEDARIILIQLLEDLTLKTKERLNISLSFGKNVIDSLLLVGYHPQFGVRELTRAVEKMIEIPLSIALAEENCEKKDWSFDLINNQIILR